MATLTRGMPTCKLRRSSCRAALEVAADSECSAASLASGSTLSGKCGSTVPIRSVGGFFSRPDRPLTRPTTDGATVGASQFESTVLLRFECGPSRRSPSFRARRWSGAIGDRLDLHAICWFRAHGRVVEFHRSRSIVSQTTRAAKYVRQTRSSLPRVGVGPDSVSRNGPRDCTRSVIPAAEIVRLKVGETRPTGRYRVSRVERAASSVRMQRPI